MVNNRKDQAVSEVMGTILMVALVVILAAVIGALVFGLGGSMQNTNLAGVSAVKVDSTHIIVTLVSSDSSVQVNRVNVSINGNNIGALGTPPSWTTPIPAGNSSLFTGAMTGNDHVVITGKFGDGTEQVLMDTYL